MIAWGKQYFWKPSPKVEAEICQRCQICPKYNPEKPIYTSQNHFPLPPGPFAICQLGVIYLSPSQGYKYVLMMVCMYSHLVEAFPCRRATPLTVANIVGKDYS